MKGEFSIGMKFAGFVRERGSGKVVNRAIVEGKGIRRDGRTFVMTVHEDGSVDLVPQDGEEIGHAERKVILEAIEDRGTTVRGDMHHYVSGMTFRDPDGGQKMLLRVTVKSPYAKLMDIFAEEEEEKPQVEVPDRLSGLLDDIMSEAAGSDADKTSNQVVRAQSGTPLPDPTAEAFERMRREKVEELARSLAKADEEVARRKHEADKAADLLKAAEAEAGIMADRVRSLGDRVPYNGFMVHVSEMTNEKVSLDEETERKIRGVVSKVKSINVDNFMKLFNTGEYQIGVFRDAGGTPVRVTDPRHLDEAAASAIYLIGAVHAGKDFVYRGDLGWHEIVDHFVCRGFAHMTRLPEDEQVKNDTK